MLNIEAIVKDKQTFRDVKSLLFTHAKFLGVIGKRLHKLSNARPEIFRKRPTSRVKELKSIVDKLNDDKKGLKDLFRGHLEDIAGIRLTIATKNQFSEAKILINKALVGIGEPVRKKSWGSRKTMNDKGYSADHYIIRRQGNGNVKCEIQIRTLTQDLWAMFTHYESYKKEKPIIDKKDTRKVIDTENKKEELRNYSRLMNVSDYYAESIRNKKIQEANKFHFEQSKGYQQKDIINYKYLENRLFAISNKSEKLKEYEFEKIDVVKLCDILKKISSYKVHSKSELENILANKRFYNEVKSCVRNLQAPGKTKKEKVKRIEINSVDALGILCQCYFNYEADFVGRNLKGDIKTLIKALVDNWKDELDRETYLLEIYSNLNVKDEKY